jgi:glycosyltransferase 2 family protein
MTAESQRVSDTEGGYPVGPAGRSILKPLLRAVVGVGIITLLVIRSDVRAIAEAIGGADAGWVGLAFALMMGSLVISAFRWEVFLRSLDLELAPGPTMRLTFVGAFFNAFLPTGVGGDAYKAMRVRGPDVPLSKTLASVLLDRIAGIVCLAALGLAAAIARLAAGDDGPVVPVASLISLGVLTAAGVLVLFGEKILRTGRSTWFGLRPRLQRTGRALTEAGTHPRSVRWGLLWGVATQVLAVAGHLALARALSLAVPAAALTLGLVIATVAATAPITINGLGFREGAWVWMLGLYGVRGDTALAYALLILGIFLATSAIGGVVYAVSGGQVTATTTRARA